LKYAAGSVHGPIDNTLDAKSTRIEPRHQHSMGRTDATHRVK
jgi:hypothetical protein